MSTEKAGLQGVSVIRYGEWAAGDFDNDGYVDFSSDGASTTISILS